MPPTITITLNPPEYLAPTQTGRYIQLTGTIQGDGPYDNWSVVFQADNTIPAWQSAATPPDRNTGYFTLSVLTPYGQQGNVWATAIDNNGLPVVSSAVQYVKSQQ